MAAPLVGGGTTRVGLTGPRHQFRRDYMYDDGSAAASTTPSGGGEACGGIKFSILWVTMGGQ